MWVPIPADKGLNNPEFISIPLPDHVPPNGENWILVSPNEIHISKLVSTVISGSGWINRFIVSVVKQLPVAIL